MREIFEVAGAILLSIGGAGTIIFGLSSFLAKVWASRILEKEKTLYSKQLEELKQRLDLQTHSGKKIFDSEFGIYQDLWQHANEIRSAAINLRSGLRKSSLSEEEAKIKYAAFKEQLWKFEHYVESQKPFFSPDVYNAVWSLLSHARSENLRTLLNRELDGIELGNDHMEGVVPVMESSEELCQRIRARLYES